MRVITPLSSADVDNQRFLCICQCWLSQAARRSESLSSRKANLSGGQQVRAPSFYKLQLIGHPVFSTKCNTPPPSSCTLNQTPATPLLLSHVLLRWTAVTGRTHCDLKWLPAPSPQPHCTTLFHFNSFWTVSLTRNALNSIGIKGKCHTLYKMP